MANNKHGLSRHIPADVKREIRRRSKFGCVHCRSAVYQYEHIDPEFSEAEEHNPNNMCLLCGRCHDKVTRGQLSKNTVAISYATVQTTDDIRRPFDEFDLNSQNLTVTLGSCIFHGAKTLIELDGVSVLAIEPPEEDAAFPTLSGYFTDIDGNEIFRIDRNEWLGPADASDVVVEGRTILVRTDSNDVVLKMIVDPPSHITVEVLNMRVGVGHIILGEDLLRLGRVAPDEEHYIGIERIECDGANVGVLVDTERFPDSTLSGFTMAGGEGIDLIGTGVKVAVGASSMTIKGLHIEHATRVCTVILSYPLETSLEGTVQNLPPRLAN